MKNEASVIVRGALQMPRQNSNRCRLYYYVRVQVSGKMEPQNRKIPAKNHCLSDDDNDDTATTNDSKNHTPLVIHSSSPSFPSTSTMAMPANSTTYPQVCLKQTEGTVILSVDKLTFQPNDSNGSGGPIHIPWPQVLKHQVSPATHSKALLKLNLTENKSTTFRLTNRAELERIRKDVTRRLHKFKQQQSTSAPAQTNGSATTAATAAAAAVSVNNKKRSHAALTAAEFGDMDPTSMAVTRSSLLAANAT
jgi:hypothetical protein